LSAQFVSQGGDLLFFCHIKYVKVHAVTVVPRPLLQPLTDRVLTSIAGNNRVAFSQQSPDHRGAESAHGTCDQRMSTRFCVHRSPLTVNRIHVDIAFTIEL